MRFLYIGQYQPGSTSRMRQEYLKEILQPSVSDVIDVSVPQVTCSNLAISLGWRFRRGPLINAVNRYVQEQIAKNIYDVIWVDKAIFLTRATTERIRERASCLIHYTPDTFFSYNYSRHFVRSLPLYDLAVTTKSFEMEAYRQAGARKLVFCSQGYDPKIHKRYHSFEEKQGVVFVGLCEPYRAFVIGELLKVGIHVKLAGPGWEKFAQRHRHYSNLSFMGRGVYGEDYARLLSGSLVGLGLLSKKFPELHTTRTFEIPACGTALCTPVNSELSNFFSEQDVFFFREDSPVDTIRDILDDPTRLQLVTENGYNKVVNGGFDYFTILKNVVSTLGLATGS